MRIGIDFDNTIVNYEGVFHAVAHELEWIPADVGVTKQDVKQYLIDKGTEPVWTELQGIVYGREIIRAALYNGVREVLEHFKQAGHSLILISHKTKYPIIGEKLDFHQAADEFLKQQGIYEYFDAVHYCEEKPLKINRICEQNLDWFIDDLPNILLDKHFPNNTNRLLFAETPPENFQFLQAKSWFEVKDFIDHA